MTQDPAGVDAVSVDVPPEAMAAALSRLRQSLGIGFAGVRRLLCLLAPAPAWDLGLLVEASGVPYRQVLDVLRHMGFGPHGGPPDNAPAQAALQISRSVVLTSEQAASLAGLLGCAHDGQPPPSAGAGDGPILALLQEVAAGLPPSVWALDHVPATVATMLARARYLASHYELAGARLLCLGDHDLTAVATKLIAPEAILSVVDVDERLLEYLDSVSERLGLELQLYSADLRMGLPRTLRQGADLVFSDPPYAQEGIGLFLRRAVEALSERPGAALAFCYGAGDRGAERMLGVQEVLASLRLSLEALLADFNSYHGAHAIGARSALWVCRPTRRTRPAVAGAEARAAGTLIYSRGPASVQSAPPALPPAILEAIRAEARGPVLLVGEGWGDGNWLPPAARGKRGLRLASLIDAATEVPHGETPRWPELVAVNLDHFAPAALLRVLMAAPPQCRLLVAAGSRALAGIQEEPLRRLPEACRRLWVAVAPVGTSPGLVVATALPPPDPAEGGRWVLRYLQEHQIAQLGNAWREALCALAAHQGRACTKNQARALVEASPLRRWELAARLMDLPLHRLRLLVQSVHALSGPEPKAIATTS